LTDLSDIGLEETLDEQQLRKYLDSGEGIVGEEQASSSVKPTSLRVL
jgi:hypothetical protein